MREKLDRSLRAILARGERITLEAGEEWTLYPLTLTDMAELEEIELREPHRAGDIGVSRMICWLSLRRNGRENGGPGGAWEMGLDDVGLIVPLARMNEISRRILALSGMKSEKKSAEPPGRAGDDRLGGALVPGADEAGPEPGRIQPTDPPPAPSVAG